MEKSSITWPRRRRARTTGIAASAWRKAELKPRPPASTAASLKRSPATPGSQDASRRRDLFRSASRVGLFARHHRQDREARVGVTGASHSSMSRVVNWHAALAIEARSNLHCSGSVIKTLPLGTRRRPRDFSAGPRQTPNERGRSTLAPKGENVGQDHRHSARLLSFSAPADPHRLDARGDAWLRTQYSAGPRRRRRGGRRFHLHRRTQRRRHRRDPAA